MKLLNIVARRTNLRCLVSAGVVILTIMPWVPVAATESAPQPAPAVPEKVAEKVVVVVPMECMRTGQRTIAALARDDTGTANQFFTFYNAFKCSSSLLAKAFSCLVNFQTENPTIANPSVDTVSQCWNDPATLPKAPASLPSPESH